MPCSGGTCTDWHGAQRARRPPGASPTANCWWVDGTGTALHCKTASDKNSCGHGRVRGLKTRQCKRPSRDCCCSAGLCGVLPAQPRVHGATHRDPARPSLRPSINPPSVSRLGLAFPLELTSMHVRQPLLPLKFSFRVHRKTSHQFHPSIHRFQLQGCVRPSSIGAGTTINNSLKAKLVSAQVLVPSAQEDESSVPSIHRFQWQGCVRPCIRRYNNGFKSKLVSIRRVGRKKKRA